MIRRDMRPGGGGGGGGPPYDDRKRRERSQESDRYAKRRPPHFDRGSRNAPATTEDPSLQLFVGGVNASTTAGEDLKDFLNQAMRDSGMVPRDRPDPIVLARMNPKFGFLDFLSLEDCSVALNLDGINYRGIPLKICRPFKYTGPKTPSRSWQEFTGTYERERERPRDRERDRDRDRDPRERDGDMRERERMLPVDESGAPFHHKAGAAAHHSPIGDPSTKLLRDLFIGGTLPEMTDAMITDFLGNAMLKMGLSNSGLDNPIMAIRMSGKYAFAVMRTVEDATNVLNLNGIPFLGVSLKLQRPARCEGQRPEIATFDFERIYDMWLSGELKLQTAGPCTRILRLSNMATSEELLDPSFYLDLMEDMRAECSQFGSVRSIIVPRPISGAAAGVMYADKDVGKVFVEMSSVEEAKNVLLYLKGRSFAGRTVDIKFYPEDTFRAQNYSLELPGVIITSRGPLAREEVYTNEAMAIILASESNVF